MGSRLRPAPGACRVLSNFLHGMWWQLSDDDHDFARGLLANSEQPDAERERAFIIVTWLVETVARHRLPHPIVTNEQAAEVHAMLTPTRYNEALRRHVAEAVEALAAGDLYYGAAALAGMAVLFAVERGRPELLVAALDLVGRLRNEPAPGDVATEQEPAPQPT